MKCSIIGVMKTHMDKYNLPVSNENAPKLLEDLCRFSGAEAGICYMKESYFDSYVTDKDKALSRFVQVTGTGHHSIAGHAQMSILFEGIPKILAMYLNNLTDYETSEKSGRYTVMTGNSVQEVTLYTKWCEIFKSVILSKYGEKVDIRMAEKLAQENARYVLSVFTPTTMSYTTSIRQWNYIIDWLGKFVKDNELTKIPFIKDLSVKFTELKEQLVPLCYVPELRDIKDRVGLDMIQAPSKTDGVDCFGKQYTVHYEATFAELAQAQRHRTLHYTAYFSGCSTHFYVPEIIEGTPYEAEWQADMRSQAAVIPQGTLLLIEENGRLQDFYLKTMERNCGRAQLEIMKKTLMTCEWFYKNILEFPEAEQELIKQSMNKSGKPKMKCEMLNCKEACVWGGKEASTRSI